MPDPKTFLDPGPAAPSPVTPSTPGALPLVPLPPGKQLSTRLTKHVNGGYAKIACPKGAVGGSMIKVTVGGPAGIVKPGPKGIWYPHAKDANVEVSNQKGLLAGLEHSAVQSLNDPTCHYLLRSATVSVGWIPELPPIKPPASHKEGAIKHRRRADRLGAKFSARAAARTQAVPVGALQAAFAAAKPDGPMGWLVAGGVLEFERCC